MEIAVLQLHCALLAAQQAQSGALLGFRSRGLYWYVKFFLSRAAALQGRSQKRLVEVRRVDDHIPKR